jgi:hypothetical protein
MSQMNSTIDVRNVLSSISVPTLVLHRSGDELPIEGARWTAAQIPGASFVELDGSEHLPYIGDWESIVDSIGSFFREVWARGDWEEPEPDRVLSTVLFTDIVGSTERAAQLGDREWADLLRMHHATVRQELARFSGRELDTAGDGFLASFGGPASSELVDGKLGGIAVHIGAGRRRGRPG